MNHLFSLILLILWFNPSLIGQDEPFDRALDAYNSGQIEESISLLEELKNNGQISEELYYNLGLSYLDSDQLAKAIANFHRALLLNPNHSASTTALELAQSKVSTPITEIPDFIVYDLFVRVAQTLSISTWAFIQIVLLIVALLMIYQILFRSRSLKSFGWLVGILLLISSWCFANAHFLKQSIVSPEIVVIQSEQTEVYVGADDRSEVLTIVGEGVTAQILDELNGWVKIELADKDIGWVPKEKVIIV